MERLANDFVTAVAAPGIGGLVGDTSLPVSAAAVLDLRNPAGQGAEFTIRVEDADGSGNPAGTNVEYMRVVGSGAAGASPWTVQRAAEEASRFPVVAHAAGSVVSHVVTTATLRALLAEVLYPSPAILAALHGYKAMTFDPGDMDTTGDVLGSGVAVFMRMQLLEAIDVSVLATYLAVSPTTSTFFKLGAMDSAGVVRCRTSDLSATLGTAGLKSGATTAVAGQSPIIKPTGPNDFYLLAALWAGTGTVRFGRRRPPNVGVSIFNMATRGDVLRNWTTAGGQAEINDQNLATTARAEGPRLWIAAGAPN